MPRQHAHAGHPPSHKPGMRTGHNRISREKREGAVPLPTALPFSSPLHSIDMATTFIKTASSSLNGFSVSISSYMYNQAALFHSSPVLDRKRRTHWDSGGGSFGGSKRNQYIPKRFRKMHGKHTLLKKVSAYAEQLFQSWGDPSYDDQWSSRDASWHGGQNRSNGTKGTSSHSQGPRWDTYRGRGKGGFQFTYGEEDIETIFQKAFSGAQFTYWSFTNDEDPFQWRSSSNYSDNSKNYRNWKKGFNYDYDNYETCEDDSALDLVSNRKILGLSASGPLKLEDVKTAYRACALKWHPDRHQGSSKAAAEEKFKKCSAAYQSLCDHME